MNPARRATLVVALALAGLVAAFWPTAVSIEAIWHRSETFAHGYLVIPITVWLVWLRRSALAAASPAWPALLLVAGGGCGWTLGRLTDVAATEQLALYVMAVGTIITIVGAPVARTLAFPLVFLVFAVPFGEFLVPVLIDRTADFTVAALQATGVPVYREGNVFTIPSGRWSVVAACSGVRYLMATVTVGALYAHLAYRTTAKRLAFLIASVIVPIVANWLRAYLIVMLGHLTDNRLATGVDHFVYGWIFFGVMIAALFWVGSFWRDPWERYPRPVAATAVPTTTTAALAAAASLALVAAMAWRPVTTALDRPVAAADRPLPPIAATGGWRELVPTGQPAWTPHFLGARSERHQWFERDGAPVGVYVALYGRQSPGHELVAADSQLVDPGDRRWAMMPGSRASLPWDGQVITVQASDLHARQAQFTARSWYWVNGRHTPSAIDAKVLLAVSRLARQPDHSAVIVLYTSPADGPDRAAARIGRFAAEMGGAVMAAVDPPAPPGQAAPLSTRPE